MEQKGEIITLVDQRDNIIGGEEKIKVHREGLLHRAFSIFVFDDKMNLLIQQRNPNKYHSGGKWANTTCGHQRYGEGLSESAHRRLQEEMGFYTELDDVFSFHYKIELDNDMTENEIDHVFIGYYNQSVSPNPMEVSAYLWVKVDNLLKDIEENPDKFAYWFRKALPMVADYLKDNELL